MEAGDSVKAMDGHTYPPLRTHLRHGTAGLHARLDAAMGPLGTTDGGDYSRFLSFQYTARQPIEAWLIEELSPSDMPPLQTPLIAHDLAQLGVALPSADGSGAFRPPCDGDPIGALWVIAGSSLGNRYILDRREKAGLAGPTRFLSATSMPEYFTGLRSRLEWPCSEDQAETAISMARAVFERFLAVMQDKAAVHDRSGISLAGGMS